MACLFQRVTLEKPEIAQFINENFVPTYYRFDQRTFDAPPSPDMRLARAGRTETVADGYGSGQICVYLCSPERQILHRLDGFVGPVTFRNECEWALKLFDRLTDAGAEKQAVARQMIKTRATLLGVATINEPRSRYLRRILSELNDDYLLRKPEPFLSGVFTPKSIHSDAINENVASTGRR